ncbi:MAG: sigma-70 family RNA polymerase sigma factor [Cytophagales bacterium]|jgi:RNA polymerase sigma factor (sigma-70 family)|nr:sigma-70 family RNA polymerase sigma factor [Cytophagales bacterium]
MTLPDEQTLWTELKQGSLQAYEDIFTLYYDALIRYGSKMTPDRQLLEDCIQDLFLGIWQRKQHLTDVISIKAYLFRALKMRLIKAQQRTAKQIRLANNDGGLLEFDYESVLIARQTDEQLKRKLTEAMKQLTKRQQEAIYLRYYDRMSYEEISEVMSVSEQAVRNLVYHAIKLLRENLILFWLVAIACVV